MKTAPTTQLTAHPWDCPVPLCNHIKPNGVRCGCPALRNQRLCFFHKKLRRPPSHNSVPDISEAHGIQHAIHNIVELLLSGKIDNKTAATAIYGMQTASSNLKQIYNPYWSDVVISDP